MKKRIICFGDSNTWGYDVESMGRFEKGQGWPAQLQERLGEEYEVISEGLGGRTTVMEDPLYEGTSGLDYIHPCLLSHSPLELVIIMLGQMIPRSVFHEYGLFDCFFAKSGLTLSEVGVIWD